MRKIHLSAGHSSKIGSGRDCGAVGNSYVEGVEMAEFRNIIYSELKKLGITATVDKDDSILADTLRYFKNLTDKNAIVIDLHMNAGSPQATGCEVLIPANYTQFEKELASEISKTIADILGIKNRGVKTELDSHHKKLAWMSLTGENVLLEVCFISNKSDVASYRENRFELGKQIAKVLYDFAQKDDKQTVEKIHIVQKGDSLSKIATLYRTTVTKLKKDNNLQSDTIKIGQKLKIQ